MSHQLTVDDARKSLTTHLAEKGQQIYLHYGPEIGWNDLLQILEDRSLVRYPCEIVFDAKQLQPGEFAVAIAKSEQPEDGFTILVHPYFALDPNQVPALVFYHLVVVNYGEFASSDDAETFGAAALGLLKEEYYNHLCNMADEVWGDAVAQS
jgi:hypothetical protein